MTSSRLPSAVSILAVSIAAAGCGRGGADAARVEAGQLAKAIHDLREAPHDAKQAPLKALEATTCTDERCDTKKNCVAAYRLHVTALGRLAAARDALGATADPMTGSAADLLGQARRELEESVELATQCAESEGTLRRRYALP
jgi:hypothetical protein